MKDLLIVVCQTSGSQADVLPSIRQAVAKTFEKTEIKKVKNPPQITELLSEIKDKYKTVAVYGGDGSIVAALKSLADTETRLLILPGGTANTIAHDLNISIDPIEVLKVYLSGTYVVSNYDIAMAGKRKFALDMHTGFWTRAVASTPRGLKKRIGALAYGVSAIKQLPKAKIFKYELDIDGRTVKANAYMILIANHGFQNILGIPVFKHAHRTGLVQIALIKSLSPPRLTIWLLARLMINKNYGGVAKTYRGHRVELIRAPKKFVMDDQEVSLANNSTIIGAKTNTKVIVSPKAADQSRFENLKLYILTLSTRFKERIRRSITGRPIFENTQLTSNLFVGGAYREAAHINFKNWNITGVINMRSTPSKSKIEGVELLHLKTRDWSAPEISTFNAGIDFIERHIKNSGAVYIHCRQGEGRGPTMAAAYLIYKGMTVEQSLDHIKRSRPVSHPNKSQRRQLSQWQEFLNSKNKN